MCITPLLSALPQGPCCGPSVGDVVLGLVPWPVWLQFVPPLQRISDTVLSLSHPHTLCVVPSRLTHRLRQCVLTLVSSQPVWFFTENAPILGLGWHVEDNIHVQWHWTRPGIQPAIHPKGNPAVIQNNLRLKWKGVVWCLLYGIYVRCASNEF